jgi:hypothetical protein
LTIEEIIASREITELLHFTTNKGLLGILASGEILSRERLPKEKYLEHVYSPNASIRRDQDWLDYVNLSVSRINEVFFKAAAAWHRNREIWWCAIGLDPALLTHDGVIFATTNNIYTGVRRAAGADGLAALFDDSVVRWHANVATRTASLPDCYPTCVQAEVLYPQAVSWEYFRQIYVPSEDAADIVSGQIGVLEQDRGYAYLPIVVDPGMLNG